MRRRTPRWHLPAAHTQSVLHFGDLCGEAAELLEHLIRNRLRRSGGPHGLPARLHGKNTASNRLRLSGCSWELSLPGKRGCRPASCVDMLIEVRSMRLVEKNPGAAGQRALSREA